MQEQCKNCGSCAHHIPTKNENPPKLAKGEGEGQVAYWICGLTGVGKYYSDGLACRNYDPRYKNVDKELRWIDKVNKEKPVIKRSYRQRTYIMSARRK